MSGTTTSYGGEFGGLSNVLWQEIFSYCQTNHNLSSIARTHSKFNVLKKEFLPFTYQPKLIASFAHQGHTVLSTRKTVHILSNKDARTLTGSNVTVGGWVISYIYHSNPGQIKSALYDKATAEEALGVNSNSSMGSNFNNDPNAGVTIWSNEGIKVAHQSITATEATSFWNAKKSETITSFNANFRNVAFGLSTGAVYVKGLKKTEKSLEIISANSPWGKSTAIYSDASTTTTKDVYIAFESGFVGRFHHKKPEQQPGAKVMPAPKWSNTPGMSAIGCVMTSNQSAITCLQKIDNSILVCGRENGEVFLISSKNWDANMVTDLQVGDSYKWSSSAVCGVRQAGDRLYIAYADGTLGIATDQDNKLYNEGRIKFEKGITNLESIDGQIFCTTPDGLYTIETVRGKIQSDLPQQEPAAASTVSTEDPKAKVLNQPEVAGEVPVEPVDPPVVVPQAPVAVAPPRVSIFGRLGRAMHAIFHRG